ncbi:hypothetical protein SAMN05216174_110163 [Actinokineospora iranica]|uniref:Uncharacterized protein n=2 Tax=Actinokineospora iranica TaxID=1271860 RepID=A0A1G6U8W3_9PSEU|nr:hypothetical protein SAMN05216174_110163 [Actinokineospora iranica]
MLLLCAPAHAAPDRVDFDAGTAMGIPEPTAVQGFLRNTVLCPEGKSPYGGGAAVVGEGTRDFKTTIQESSPGTIGGGARTLWLASVRNNDSAAHTVGVFATCADKLAGYQKVSKTIAIPAGSAERTTVICPSGKVALGGGAAVVGEGTRDFKTTIQETTPGTVGGGAYSLWGVSIRNDDNASHTVGFTVVCADPPAGYELVRRDLTVPAGGFLRDIVRCPSGKVALGGGAAVVGEGSQDFKTAIQETAPGTVGANDQSVWLTALRNGDAKSHQIGLFAACTNPPSGYHRARQDYSVPGV